MMESLLIGSCVKLTETRFKAIKGGKNVAMYWDSLKNRTESKETIKPKTNEEVKAANDAGLKFHVQCYIYLFDIQWNSGALTAKAKLEAILDDNNDKVFGLVRVSCTPYIPQSHSWWSGRYILSVDCAWSEHLAANSSGQRTRITFGQAFDLDANTILLNNPLLAAGLRVGHFFFCSLLQDLGYGLLLAAAVGIVQVQHKANDETEWLDRNTEFCVDCSIVLRLASTAVLALFLSLMDKINSSRLFFLHLTTYYHLMGCRWRGGCPSCDQRWG
jgi:hypothetical protein